jgi:hypothetical protein
MTCLRDGNRELSAIASEFIVSFLFIAGATFSIFPFLRSTREALSASRGVPPNRCNFRISLSSQRERERERERERLYPRKFRVVARATRKRHLRFRAKFRETRIAAAIPSTVHFGRQVASCAALTKRCNFLESVLTAAPRRARKLQRYRARLTAARRRKIETEKVSSLAPAIRRIPFLSPFVAHSATFLTLCQPRRSALIRPLARCNPVNRPARQFH